MIRDRHITEFFHAKGATVLIGFLACVSCAVAWERGAVVQIAGNLGFGLPSANLWLGFGWVSAVVNLGINMLVAMLTVYINREFNVLRSLTSLVATMFLVMQIALPVVLGQFYGGTLLALLMMVCTMLLFSVFGYGDGQRRVFMMFFLLGCAAFTQLAYLFYAPVLLIGTMQMRMFSLRTFLAALLGLITPAWIAFGLGFIDPSQLSFPEMVVAWSLFNTADMVQTMAAAAVTVVTGIVFTVANILKILSYNSRVRAYNGFFTMLFAFTTVFALVNFNNFTFYLPLLDVLAAYQVGHFFTYRRHRRSYIAILLIIAIYAALYCWAVA